MITNGHGWMGYEDSAAHVPSMPLMVRRSKIHIAGCGVDVVDSSNYWMATFRNWEDAQPYIRELTDRYNKGRAEWEKDCTRRDAEETARDRAKRTCPQCGKVLNSSSQSTLKNHLNMSQKCKEKRNGSAS